jgi:hypothetical protein
MNVVTEFVTIQRLFAQKHFNSIVNEIQKFDVYDEQ